MKSFHCLLLLSALLFGGLLSHIDSKTIEIERKSSGENNSLENVSLTENDKRPLVNLITTVEEFVEGSVHSLVEDFFVKNQTVTENLAHIMATPLHVFHNFTTQIEAMGDMVFKRQQSIINLVQCECPDTENNCNHIIARKVSYSNLDDDKRRDLKDDESHLPVIDIIKLVRHFQQHFSNVLQTQKKLFEYAQCACPNKKECIKAKNRRNQINANLNEDDKIEEIADMRVNRRYARSNHPEESKGFFSDFFSWISNIFGDNPKPLGGVVTQNVTYPNGTQFYSGVLPNGAHYSGGEYHDGNSAGYFISTHKNDSTGNSYSSSSSSSGGGSFFFGRK